MTTEKQFKAGDPLNVLMNFGHVIDAEWRAGYTFIRYDDAHPGTALIHCSKAMHKVQRWAVEHIRAHIPGTNPVSHTIMDPNANLLEQREIVSRMLDSRGKKGDGERLAELVEALDEWISNGGFLPSRWQQK